ncbi:MAG: PAS domain S-box protein [Thermoplasmatota archaeon]
MDASFLQRKVLREPLQMIPPPPEGCGATGGGLPSPGQGRPEDVRARPSLPSVPPGAEGPGVPANLVAPELESESGGGVLSPQARGAGALPFITVSMNGTVVSISRAGEGLAEELGLSAGGKLPPELCGLIPKVLETGEEEVLVSSGDGVSIVRILAPRVRRRPLWGGAQPPDASGGGRGDDVKHLRARADFFEALVEAMPSGVFLMDLSRRCVLSNASFERMTGFRREEVAAGRVRIQVHPDFFESTEAAFLEAIRRGRAVCRSRLRVAGGSWAELDLFLSSLVWRERKFVLALVSPPGGRGEAPD